MKKIIVACFISTIAFSGVNAQFGKIKLDSKKLTEAAGNAVNAVTLSDADVAQMCKEYVDWSDANNPLCELTSKDKGMKAYAVRLDKLVKNYSNYDGLVLDFKVYYVTDINAFACANGSVRVMAGLMDIMTDEELLGVIGHEIGHIKNGDSKAAMKQAYLTAAGKGLIASTGSAGSKFTNSQFGALGEALLGSQYSQKQEYAADEYGYNFLKAINSNSAAMASSLRKLQALSESNTPVGQLFSSHPDSGKRAAKLEAKDAKK